eukprot:GFUD01138001.1.p1 GENE.GFUD01138001.1~~GFUD01138001.1.p1  ORF type:complete len:221 (+),score=59.42 GFUD01138001.1:47-664(+)
MESFLDEFCLQSKNDVNHEEFEVTFKYNFLAPPIEILPSEVQGPYSDEEETEKISEKHARKKFALPETESLWYMGQSKEHRYLLRHPVITSFLWCKWTRIRRVTGAQGILLFYNFLPDKHLTIKPNSKSYNCIKVEKVGDEIIDAAKTIILRKQKEDGSGDTQQQVEERNKEIEQRFEDAAVTNKILVKKVSDLEKKIDMLINKF